MIQSQDPRHLDASCFHGEIRKIFIWIIPLSKALDFELYRIYRKYSDRQACANSIDSDEMLQDAASH